MQEAAGTSRWGYRPHLDGLRAVAVYLVVAFHAGIDRLLGGFIGVDVFFVLSGYLVTNLLVRDLEGPDERVGFGRFYSRRARRLLPAAALNLVVTAVVFGAIAAPVELADARGGIRAAALYFANWHFISQSNDYFAADINASPVVHYWSLSVEEQFYLVWPLLLGGLYAVARRAGAWRRTVVRVAIVGGGLASLGFALHLSTGALDRAYYGTDTRAYQLLAGAALAVTPGLAARVRRSRLQAALPVASIGLVAVLVVLASSLVDVNPIRRGVLVTVAVVGLLLTLEAATGGIARRLLSWSPLVYLGKISYGTYLWHWLVIVVLARKADLSPISTAALATVLATGLASLSFQVFEHPIRTVAVLDRLRPAVIAGGLTMSLLVGLVVVPQIFDHTRGPRAEPTAATATGATAVDGRLPSKKAVGDAFFSIYDISKCPSSAGRACTLATGTGKKAIVVGESHAEMFAPMLTELAHRHDLTLAGGFLSFCPWTLGVQYTGVSKHCYKDQHDLFDRILPALDPDIVFLAHRAVDDPNDPLALGDEDAGLLEGDQAREAALRRRITALVTKLRADGRTVIMFEPVPVVDKEHNTLTCLSTATSVDACRFVAPGRPLGEVKVMRALASKDPRVISVDLDPLVCPYLPICDPVVGGRIVKRDQNHLTVSFATSLLDPIDSYLTGQGAFR